MNELYTVWIIVHIALQCNFRLPNSFEAVEPLLGVFSGCTIPLEIFLRLAH